MGLRENISWSRQKTYRQFYPLVALDWKPGNPVSVLLETPDYTSEEMGLLLSKNSFPGIWRHVLWEGPKSRQLDYLRAHYGLIFSPAPLLLELNANTADEATFCLYLLAIIGLTVLACFVSTWMLFKR